MDITNTAPRLIHLPSVEGAGNVQLIPGKNSVGPSYWQQVKAHPKVRSMLALGVLVEGVVKVPETPKGPISTPTEPAPPEDDEVKDEPKAEEGNPLADLSTADAKDVIENENDVERMQGWLLLETRKGVKATIAARIKAVKSEA